MKVKFELHETEIKEAIKDWVKKNQGVKVRYVYLSYHKADSLDPREYSYFTAEASQ